MWGICLFRVSEIIFLKSREEHANASKTGISKHRYATNRLIYRWYKGKILPSVDHLLMLSELLNVHMEDLLVKKNAVPVLYDIEQCYVQTAQKRFITYYKKIYQSVA